MSFHGVIARVFSTLSDVALGVLQFLYSLSCSRASGTSAWRGIQMGAAVACVCRCLSGQASDAFVSVPRTVIPGSRARGPAVFQSARAAFAFSAARSEGRRHSTSSPALGVKGVGRSDRCAVLLDGYFNLRFLKGMMGSLFAGSPAICRSPFCNEVIYFPNTEFEGFFIYTYSPPPSF